MNINELTIGQAREIASMFAAQISQEVAPAHEYGLAIAVLDRGFVYIGQVKTNAQWCDISEASNVRYWGTKKGLGQLALEGPQPETSIDAVGLVHVPMHAVISIIPVKAVSQWKKLL